jgi:SAM-dependent methyltransferase
MVEEEHAQSDAMRPGPSPVDHWQPYAEQFRADPHRTDDLLLERLLAFVELRHTVIDVGAGGGRLALPIALKCQRVVAVEPSESMASVLEDQARQSGIENVTVVRSRWEEAEIDAGDVALCAHVVYVVRDIGAFLRKLDAHARDRVLVALFNAAPQSQTYSLWRRIHGKERLALPSLPQLREVLAELEIDAQVDPLPAQNPRGFDSMESALDQLSSRLYLTHGSEEYIRLERMLPDILMEEDGAFKIKDAEPIYPVIVSWRPDMPK